jgi:hypothetical protein
MVKSLASINNTNNDNNNVDDPISKLKQLMIERANENRRRAKKKSDIKKEKDTEPKVKGKRGRKPKILVDTSQIIDYPVS